MVYVWFDDLKLKTATRKPRRVPHGAWLTHNPDRKAALEMLLKKMTAYASILRDDLANAEQQADHVRDELRQKKTR